MQEQEWDPIISWFNKRYDVNISKSRSIESPVVNEEVKNRIHRHLMSYNFESLVGNVTLTPMSERRFLLNYLILKFVVLGFMFAVDTVKSVILTLACVDMFITTQKAVLLSRLEEEYQVKF